MVSGSSPAGGKEDLNSKSSSRIFYQSPFARLSVFGLDHARLRVFGLDHIWDTIFWGPQMNMKPASITAFKKMLCAGGATLKYIHQQQRPSLRVLPLIAAQPCVF